MYINVATNIYAICTYIHTCMYNKYFFINTEGTCIIRMILYMYTRHVHTNTTTSMHSTIFINLYIAVILRATVHSCCNISVYKCTCDKVINLS